MQKLHERQGLHDQHDHASIGGIVGDACLALDGDERNERLGITQPDAHHDVRTVLTADEQRLPQHLEGTVLQFAASRLSRFGNSHDVTLWLRLLLFVTALG